METCVCDQRSFRGQINQDQYIIYTIWNESLVEGFGGHWKAKIPQYIVWLINWQCQCVVLGQTFKIVHADHISRSMVKEINRQHFKISFCEGKNSLLKNLNIFLNVIKIFIFKWSFYCKCKVMHHTFGFMMHLPHHIGLFSYCCIIWLYLICHR